MAILSENMVFSKTRTQDLRNVKQLNCWGSELADVSLVRQMPFVQVLSLSVNSIKSLSDFSYCKNLQELYLRDNKVSDLSQLLHLQQLPQLKKLWLSGNPCSDVPNYRLIVLKILPHLEMLDNIPVSQEEVMCADNLPVELDEETGEIVVPEPHPVTRKSHGAGSSSHSLPSDREVDEEEDEEETVLPHMAHTASVPPVVQRQHSTPEPQVHQQQQQLNGQQSGHRLSQQVVNQRFSYESDAASTPVNQRLRQPPAHPVTPVLAATQSHGNNNNGTTMVRSASIADYSGFSGESFGPAGGGAGQGHGTGSKSAMMQRMLPKGGRNRNANILSAILCLIKELDVASLEVVDTEIHCRMEELGNA